MEGREMNHGIRINLDTDAPASKIEGYTNDSGLRKVREVFDSDSPSLTLMFTYRQDERGETYELVVDINSILYIDILPAEDTP